MKESKKNTSVKKIWFKSKIYPFSITKVFPWYRPIPPCHLNPCCQLVPSPLATSWFHITTSITPPLQQKIPSTFTPIITHPPQILPYHICLQWPILLHLSPNPNFSLYPLWPNPTKPLINPHPPSDIFLSSIVHIQDLSVFTTPFAARTPSLGLSEENLSSDSFGPL